MNDVAMCFAALEMIAKEAPTKSDRGEEIRTRILATGGSESSEERAIREEAAELLEAVSARAKAA